MLAALGGAGVGLQLAELEGDEELEFLALELGGGIAPESLDPGAGPEDGPLRVGHDGGVVERLEDLFRQVGEVAHHLPATYHSVRGPGMRCGALAAVSGRCWGAQS